MLHHYVYTSIQISKLIKKGPFMFETLTIEMFLSVMSNLRTFSKVRSNQYINVCAPNSEWYMSTDT